LKLAFKFLRDGGVGPFSYFRWPLPGPDGPGDWVIAAAHGPACVRGVHACDAEHLADWMAPELWVIELAGEIFAASNKLVAPRGRLLRRVEGWNREKADAMAAVCIRRARDLTCERLRRVGEEAAADRLAACAELSAIEATARERSAGGQGEAALALGYLADAVFYAAMDPPASMFVAAHAALTEEGFARERAWQSRWLADDLGLGTLIAT
jgi:hypothetical protein